MLDCGFSPLMSSLSDRNMRLGDVLLPPGIKQRCMYLRVQGLFTLRKVLLMQLYVSLSLHFGWDSQLNTSEMFWIDISRWMIRSMDFGLLTLAYCPLLLSPSFICSIVSIVLPSKSCQFPNYDLFTSLALLSSLWRETSLVKITGPRSIFTLLFTPSIYFQPLLSFALLSLALILCKRQGRRN